MKLEMVTMSWTFGDPIGWMVGCLVFGLFSLILGGGVYGNILSSRENGVFR